MCRKVPTWDHCHSRINDLAQTTDTNNLFYADDLKIYLSISDLRDCDRLQNDIDEVCNQYVFNNLSLNVSKCTTMTFTRKKCYIRYSYALNYTILDRHYCIKALGIVFDFRLSFVHHIRLKVLEANRMCGFIVKVSSTSFV